MSKIKVLFLGTDAFEQNALSLDEEVRAITARLRLAKYRDRFEIVAGLGSAAGRPAEFAVAT